MNWDWHEDEQWSDVPGDLECQAAEYYTRRRSNRRAS